MIISVDQRLPLQSRKSSVNRAHLFLDLFSSIYIFRNGIPRRNYIEHKNNLFSPLRIILQKFFEALKAVAESFCIIKPIDREYNFLVVKSFLKRCAYVHYNIVGDSFPEF